MNKDKFFQIIFHKFSLIKKIYNIFFGAKRYKYLNELIRKEEDYGDGGDG